MNCLLWAAESVGNWLTFVAHICETGIRLSTEGSGIVLFFFVSWIDIFQWKLHQADNFQEHMANVFFILKNTSNCLPFQGNIGFVRLRGLNCLLGAAESELLILRGVYSRVMYHDLKRTCFDFIWLFICCREDSSFGSFTSGKFCRLTVALLC